jgi:hypothetical protein
MTARGLSLSCRIAVTLEPHALSTPAAGQLLPTDFSFSLTNIISWSRRLTSSSETLPHSILTSLHVTPCNISHASIERFVAHPQKENLRPLACSMTRSYHGVFVSRHSSTPPASLSSHTQRRIPREFSHIRDEQFSLRPRHSPSALVSPLLHLPASPPLHAPVTSRPFTSLIAP